MKTIILTAVAALMVSGVAMANEHEGHKGPHAMEKIDTNKDGVVSKAESQAFNDKRFDEMDTNKDGNLTKEEREAHRAVMKEKRAARKAAKAATSAPAAQ
jgi:hypothetical protein